MDARFAAWLLLLCLAPWQSQCSHMIRPDLFHPDLFYSSTHEKARKLSTNTPCKARHPDLIPPTSNAAPSQVKLAVFLISFNLADQNLQLPSSASVNKFFFEDTKNVLDEWSAGFLDIQVDYFEAPTGLSEKNDQDVCRAVQNTDLNSIPLTVAFGGTR